MTISNVEKAYRNGTRWARNKELGSVLVAYDPKLTSYQMCDTIARGMYSEPVRLHSKFRNELGETRLYFTVSHPEIRLDVLR